MSFITEIQNRRVVQIFMGYVVACWGIVQFVSFIEERYQLSPYLVDAVGVALLLVLPSVVLMTWCHGRPGKDPWTRFQRVFVPANLIGAAAILLLTFGGKDLGAVTRTVAVTNEDGEVTERAVPKQQYRQRILLFAPDTATSDGDEAANDEWLGWIVQTLLISDLSQDPFISFVVPQQFAEVLKREGFPDGENVPVSLQQQLAETHSAQWFTRGEVSKTEAGYDLRLDLYEVSRGTAAHSREYSGPDLFALVDQASIQLRLDAGIPESFVESTKDLPAGELHSRNLDAVRLYVQAQDKLSFDTDYGAAKVLFDQAVELDPAFGDAHFMRYLMSSFTQQSEEGRDALETAMKHDYRLSERMQFIVKANYYIEIKEDPEKALSVVKMWASLHPDDAEAYNQLGHLHALRGENEDALEAFRAGWKLDPTRKEFLEAVGRIEQELGRLEDAEATFRKLVEMYPEDADYLVRLARLSMRQGDLEDAAGTYERAMLLDSERLDIRLSHIEVLSRLGKDNIEELLEEAFGDAQTAQDSTRALQTMASYYSKFGKSSEAIRCAELWSQVGQSFMVPIRYWVARAGHLRYYAETGDREQVLDRIARVRSELEGPSAQVAGSALGAVFLEIGEPDSAETCADELDAFIDRYQFEALRATSHMLRGRIAEERGDFETALSYYEKEEAGDGPGSDLFMRRGRCQRQAGDLDAALASLMAAAEQDPASPKIRLELARVHEDADRLDEARTELETALTYWKDAEPEFIKAQEAREMAVRIGLGMGSS